MFGDLDPKINRLAATLLGPGHTVVDIGANVGVFSLPAAKHVGRTGVVHAIEPQPDLVQRLETARDRNGLPQMVIHGVALAESDRIAHLSIPEHNRGAGSLILRRPGDRRLPVPVRHAGDFLKRHIEGPVRLVKIDAEGSEAAIFRGALGWFSHVRPDAIIFEAKEHRSYDDNAVVSLLREMGYAVHPILPSLRRLRLASHTYAGSFRGIHDILALAPGVVGKDCTDSLLRAGARFV